MSPDDNTHETPDAAALPQEPDAPKPAKKPQSIPPRGSKRGTKPGTKPSPGGGGR